jgi:hypothetical protein
MEIQRQLQDAANEFYMNSGGHHPTFCQCNPVTFSRIQPAVNWNGIVSGTEMKVSVFPSIEDDMVIIGTDGVYPLTKKLD